MIREIEKKTTTGLPVLLGTLGVDLLTIALFATQNPVAIVLGILILITSIFVLCGLMNIAPNEARVLQLFGEYKGTAKEMASAGRTRFTPRQRSASASETLRARS